MQAAFPLVFLEEVKSLLPSRQAVFFALQMVGATALALFLAYVLQLESPGTAALTVWIVGNPALGPTLSKSFHRMIGTLVGATAAVTIMALFAQAPGFFITALALWIGLGAGVGTLLRNFRSYGSILAGYTAAMVCMGVLDHPLSVFHFALTRASAVIVGIACGTLVPLLFAPRRAYQEAWMRMREAAQAVLRHADRAVHLDGLGSNLEARLFADVMALETAIEFAAVESPGFRPHEQQARETVAALIGLATEAAALGHDLSLRPASALQPLLRDMEALFRDFPFEGGGEELEALRSRINALRGRLEGAASSGVSALTMRRLRELLACFGAAAENWVGARFFPAHRRPARPAFHPNYPLALRNGIRAFLGTLGAGCFWIWSTWPAAANFVVLVSIVSSLFAVAGVPTAVVGQVLKGGLWGVLAAFLCSFFFMQQVDGFPLLVLCLAPFLMFAGLLIFSPATSIMGAGFSILFFLLLPLNNPSHYDLIGFLNNTMAVVGGIVWGLLIYHLIPPPDSLSVRGYLEGEVRRDLERLASAPRPMTVDAWRHTMFDRLHLLHKAGAPLEGPLAALHVGIHILRLRALQEAAGKEGSRLRPALEAFRAPAGRVERLRAAGDGLGVLASEGEAWEEAAERVEESALMLERETSFFRLA